MKSEVFLILASNCDKFIELSLPKERVGNFNVHLLPYCFKRVYSQMSYENI